MSTAAFDVNHEIWRALVGSSIEIPAINSNVYYFPQGHLENSSAVDYNHTGVPSIQCRVLFLRFLSTSSSDESFVKIYLKPLDAAALQHTNENDENVNNESDIVSFSKILTPSDVKNGGGLSVPRYGADAVFPQLDMSKDPPKQDLSIRDAYNNAWEFRHIFRGNPQRHLLNGWSKFVNDKRLVAGDSVVFMKRISTEELFIGIKRNARTGGDETQRIQAAVAAIEDAKKGKMFEVDYYPMSGFPKNFVVSAARVDRSMRINWCSDMRVKMRVPSDDHPGRVAWLEGRIESANFRLPQSPWRTLEVNWDEAETHPNIKRVISPWEVECLSSSSHHFSGLPPCKKSKLSQNPPEILPDDYDGDQGEFSFPLLEPHLNSAASFNYPPFPPVVECDVSHPQSFTELLMRGMENEFQTVSNELNIGSSSYERSSTNVQKGQNSSAGDWQRSIMLLGTMIWTEERPMEEGGLRDNGGLIRDVQPNSSPEFRDNCKGKNIVYE